jgi:hypothetical protein
MGHRKADGESDQDPTQRPFSLENAQRDLLGVFDEPMPFNTATLGSALREIADNVPEIKTSEWRFLRAVADALDDPAAEWRLSLARTIRGKFIPPDQHVEQEERDALIGYWMDKGLEKYGKQEAAIADVAARLSISRATIFAALHRRRELAALLKQFRADNPALFRKG